VITILTTATGIKKQLTNSVGIEVLTAVVMKSTVFRDITPCSPLKSTNILEGHVTIFWVEE
jgi:hypothetical protein